MDRFDFDEVIVETVGVGQVELAARVHVDTLVLVIPPDAGDVVQAMKAGIVEIADVFAINKARHAVGRQRCATEIKRIVGLTRRSGAGWTPPVIMTAKSKPESIAELSREIDRHWRVVACERRTGNAQPPAQEVPAAAMAERKSRGDHRPGSCTHSFEASGQEQMRILLQRLSDSLAR